MRALTRDYLVRATYSYLQKFATTEKNLRDVLDRKVRRRLSATEAASEERYAEARAWIDEIVARAVEQNLVDDRQFATARAASLVRSGNSTRMIARKLMAKGVETDMVKATLDQMTAQHPDMDRLAAVKYARKRRFGAFHPGFGDAGDERDVQVTEKQLASMCRAGFSYEVAQSILRLSLEEAEAILFQARL